LNFDASGRYTWSRCCHRAARGDLDRRRRDGSHLGSHGLWLRGPPHTEICKLLKRALSVLHWNRRNSTVQSAIKAVSKLPVCCLGPPHLRLDHSQLTLVSLLIRFLGLLLWRHERRVFVNLLKSQTACVIRIVRSIYYVAPATSEACADALHGTTGSHSNVASSSRKVSSIRSHPLHKSTVLRAIHPSLLLDHRNRV
jgi:hypothetical protein